MLSHELNSISGRSVQTSRATQRMAQDNDTLARSANNADRGINQLTGRLRLFADLAAILGPSLIPIGAVGIPAVAGLANQFGAAALAGGAAILAFQGVGSALTAMNKAALDPTAANLAAAQLAMDKLGPAAQQLVLHLQDLRPALDGLRQTAAAGLFPGLLDGIDALEGRLPDLERILSAITTETGRTIADSADSLASGRWDDFFDFLATQVPQTLSSIARTTGDLTHGLSELWMAFDPLNDDFSGWLEDVANGFDSWASGVDQTQGFADFLDYVRTNGPQVADTAAALADAVLQIVEAAAPLGGPTLHALEAIARAVAAIADSDLGTPIMAGVSALALLSRAQRTYNALATTGWGSQAKANLSGFVSALTTVTTAQERATTAVGQLTRRQEELRKGAGTLARGAAGIAALTLATTGAADGMGLTNTATLGLMGTLAGPWGAAVGAGAGLVMDFAAANDEARDAIDAVTTALHDQPEAFEANARLISDQAAAFEEFRSNAEDGNMWDGFVKGITLNKDAISNALEEIFGTSEVDEQRAAVLANQEAFERQKQAVSDLANEVRGNDAWVDYTQNLQDLQGVAASLQPAMDHFGITIEDLGNADPQLFGIFVDNIKDYIKETDSAEGRTRDVAAAISGLDDDLLSTADSADQLSAALKQLLDPTLNAEEATDAWRQSLKDMRAELTDGLKTFQGFTQDAMKNREVTRGVVEDTLSMLTARAEAGASAGQIARSVLQSRDAFIAEGIAAGFTAKQMRQRANEIGLTPKLVKTVFDAVGIDLVAAKARGIANQLEALPKEVQVQLRNAGYDLTKSQIDALQKEYDLTPEQVQTILRAQDNASAVITEVDRRREQLDGSNAHVTLDATANTASAEARLAYAARDRYATIYINTVGTSGTFGGRATDGSADGNLFDRTAGSLTRTFASGGFAGRIGNQMPQIRPYSGPRGLLWSEEGSGPWEAFISGHPNKVNRSRAIAAEVVQRLGGQVAFANGGMVQRHRVPDNVVAARRTSAPLSVAVGGPRVQVFVDGREVRAVVRSEMSAEKRWEQRLDDRD